MSVLFRTVANGVLFFAAGMVLASLGVTVGMVRYWMMIAIMIAVYFVGVMR